MSQGMLGTLPLSDVRGPRDTLEQCLAGGEGERWLTALNKFLRGENPWPSVRNIETGYSITVGQEKRVGYLRDDANFDCVDSGAEQILNSDKFVIEKKKWLFEIVLLDFGPVGFELRLPHVLSEIKRLELERPSFEDALLFAAKYPHVQEEKAVTFLHEPFRCRRGGYGVSADRVMYDGFLSLDEHGVIAKRILTTTDAASLFARRRHRFVARKRVRQPD